MLKNQHCFQFNRFYLLGSLLLSLVLPLIKVFTLSVNSTTPFDPSIFIMPEVIVTDQETPKSATIWFNLFYIGYGLGVSIFISRFIYQLSGIVKYIIKNRKARSKKFGYYIIDTNGEIPTSSFFNYILWDNTQTLTTSEREQVLRHERVHVFQNHSIDIIMLEIFKVLFWFNPTIWFVKRSLKETHEYMADSNAYYNLDSYAKLLAKQALLQQGISIVHSFKSANVFKRLEMLSDQNKTTTPLYRYLGVAVVFVFMLFTMSFSVEKINEWKTEGSQEFNNGLIFEDYDDDSSDYIFTIVDEPASPKQGMAAFYAYIDNNLLYPKQARMAGIEGKVYVEFVIDKNGKVTEAKVLKGIGAECNAIALKIVSEAPNWNPGKQNGKTVKQKIVLPIAFHLK